MKNVFLLLTIFTFALSAGGQDCTTMPDHFPSYEAAMLFARKAYFKVKEDFRIYKSSWLTRAEYYSCNGTVGIFIFTTDKGGEYIMRGIPTDVWKGFKNADDYGVYYNKYIRGKYHFPL